MEILSYEGNLRGFIHTRKEDSSGSLCQREVMLLTGALLELSQDGEIEYVP